MAAAPRPTSPLARRPAAPLAAVLALIAFLGLAACGTAGGTADGSADPATTGTPSQSAGAFPVRIEDAFGTTTIESRPERVVTLGYTDHDPVLALGVVPVLVQQWMDDYPQAIGPWAKDELGDRSPEVIKGEEIPYERIAAADPDLIIAIYRALKPEQHEKLAAIAPVIAKPADVPDYGTSWQRTTRIIGKALGRADRASELITHVEGLYDKARSNHPEFKGKEAVVAMIQPGGKYYGYTSADPRVRAMASLGFTVPKRFDKMGGASFYATISQERLDLLNADVLVLIGVGEALAEAKQDPLFSRLDVVRDGHVVYLHEDLMNAFSHNDVLSIPWTLHRVVPKLSDALG